MLSGLAAKQRAREDRALNVATDLANSVASASRRQFRGHTISEPVVEAEVSSSHTSGSSREVAELVAEVEAGGVVARPSLESCLSLQRLPTLKVSSLQLGLPVQLRLCCSGVAQTRRTVPSPDLFSRCCPACLLLQKCLTK